MGTGLLLVLRGLLLCCSFTGLCAVARCVLKLNRFISPLFTASGIIVALMLGGMASALLPVFCAIYIAGFAGMIYVYAIKRRKPDVPVILLYGVFLAYLIWRMYPAKLFSSDDLSHWGLVSRHLLRTNALPDASARTVMFQAYPLGSAAFAYYVGRTLENTEGIWLIANEFLYCLAFLPVLAHVRGNRGWAWGVLGGLFFFLYGFMRQFGSLRVDGLLGFYGIGLAASALFYRDDWKMALLSVCTSLIAVVYLKSSGLFFAVMTALLLAWNAKNGPNRKKAVLVFVSVLAAAIGAFLLWELHVRLAFPVGLQTKHAVSIANYKDQLNGKDSAMILAIAKKMAHRTLHPSAYIRLCLAFVLAGGVLYGAVAALSPTHRKEARSALRTVLFALGLFLLWQGMLFLMYIFSMPAEEARVLASYSRYVNTAAIAMAGIAAVAGAAFFSAVRLRFRYARACGFALSLAFLAAVLAATAWKQPTDFKTVFARGSGYNRQRLCLVRAKEALNLPAGANCLYFWDLRQNDLPLYTLFYYAKYEYDTMDATIIVAGNGGDAEYEVNVIGAGDPMERASGHAAVSSMRTEELADPMDFIRAHIDAYDALIVCDRDDALQRDLTDFLSAYSGDTPVWLAGATGPKGGGQ